MKRNIALILFILLTGSSLSFAGGNGNHAPSDSFNFRIRLGFTATNAIDVTESVVQEEIEGKSTILNIYTLTIPFFESSFNGQLEFINTPKKINAGNYILPSKLPAPCKGSELIVYDAFVMGKVIGSMENAMELSIHQYSAAAGIHQFRAIASCGSMMYAAEYFRLIVKRETKPVLAVKLHVEQGPGDLTGVAYEQHDKVTFRLSGKTPANNNLYLKVIPPCGTSCKKTDYQISELLASQQFPSDSAFYSCDLNGLYMATLLYKHDKVGGGAYHTEISLPEWTNYSYLHENKNQSPEKKLVTEKKAADDIISILPNPVTDILKVQLPDRNNYNISTASVYNSAGQVLIMQETNSRQFTIDFTGKASGTYIIKINFEGNSYSEKVIKK